ncbi:MAG: amino acid ABC transporter permease [Jatrophihabitantaceae bacterium]
MTQVEPDRTGTRAPSQIRAVPVRHPGRWVAAAVLLLLAAMAVHAVVFARIKRGGTMQDRFGWHVVGQYFLSRQVLDGLVLTLELTVIAMAIGIVGGVLLAVMRLSANPIVRWVAWAYIWFFRGTPVLVQLLFWFSLNYVFPKLSLGIPFGPEWVHIDANQITPFVLAFVGLGLNEAAYMSEIVRAGIISVDEGQAEAAQALGMTRLRTMRRIVLPQAMRVIIPPTGNETISMLKTSSLASVITVTELLYSVQLIYASTYQIVPMLLVASLWYLIVTSILTAGQYYVERYFGRGSARALPLTPLQRFRRMFGSHAGIAHLDANVPTPEPGR